LPLAFNAFFFLLARRFDYPNILREVAPSSVELGGGLL
jgi:hypothetical protein